MIPPCQPNFNIVTNCDDLQNVISWSFPNSTCGSDAVQYNIYFSPTVFDPLQIIYTTTDMSTTTFIHQYLFDGTIPSVTMAAQDYYVLQLLLTE